MIMLGLTSAGQHTDRTAFLDGCIAQIVGGNKNALALLYQETSDAVYGYSLSVLKNPCYAEEVMQDVYLKLWSNAGSYHSQGKPMAWILTIARNLALSRLREEKHTVPVTEEQWGQFPAANPFPSAEDRLVLETALRVLTDQERQILMLHALSGLKHREIAVLLELPLPTVLSKYHRSRKKMLQEMKEDCHEEN